LTYISKVKAVSAAVKRSALQNTDFNLSYCNLKFKGF